ncbi:MAG TPA: Xaa-Pro peptidase family protein [Bacillota bacterium]|jgi:Xaa-Pro aminopeptidase
MVQVGKDVLKKVASSLAGEGLAGVVAMSPENAPYVSGFAVPSQKIIRGRLVMCVISANGDSCQVVADMEESYTKAYTSLARVRAYNEFTETPMKALTDVLTQMGLARRKVAIDVDYIPANAWEELRRLMPDTQFVDSAPFFTKMHAIKTPGEIDNLRTLAHAVDGAHKAVAAKAKPGMTEMDVAMIIYEHLFKHGADDIAQLCVGSGERSLHANPYATERRLTDGDVMRIDIYAKRNCYLSDCARTYVVGEPTAAEKDLWQKMLETRRMCLEMVKPGAHTAEIYKVFHDKFTAWGLKPINFVGHGLGLSLHEDPYVGRYGDWVLQEGMVLCIEPYVVFPERNAGFQVEDEVLVTANGYELLTGFDGDPVLAALR